MFNPPPIDTFPLGNDCLILSLLFIFNNLGETI